MQVSTGKLGAWQVTDAYAHYGKGQTIKEIFCVSLFGYYDLVI